MSLSYAIQYIAEFLECRIISHSAFHTILQCWLIRLNCLGVHAHNVLLGTALRCTLNRGPRTWVNHIKQEGILPLLVSIEQFERGSWSYRSKMLEFESQLDPNRTTNKTQSLHSTAGPPLQTPFHKPMTHDAERHCCV